ncbi:hypothetical protein [Flagellimonas sp.]
MKSSIHQLKRGIHQTNPLNLTGLSYFFHENWSPETKKRGGTEKPYE